MNYYIVKYWQGFNTRRCLVVSDSESNAMLSFYKAHPSCRAYNVISIRPTTGKVYELC